MEELTASNNDPTLNSAKLALTSRDTALCLLPPRHLWPSFDRLRSFYDRAHGTWPPHINLLYPFVAPDVLADAAQVLGQLDLTAHHQALIHLDAADTFSHKHHNTIFLRPARDAVPGPCLDPIPRLRSSVSAAFGQPAQPSHGEYQPHMTIAQSEDSTSASHNFLVDKVRLLAPVTWGLGQIAILVRDPAPLAGHADRRQMSIWGFLDISSGCFTRHLVPEALYDYKLAGLSLGHGSSSSTASPQTSYHFRESSHLTSREPSGSWQAALLEVPDDTQHGLDQPLVVASYNVLAEFEWPPKSTRYPGLVENLLANHAVADILVIQEVTDHFLSFLLADPQIRRQYPFSTHAPASQAGIGPLPSFLNVVVMSRFPLQWAYLPFERKHKGCAVVTFPTIGACDAHGCFLPLVLAACHLSQGLVDGAIAAKKNEVQRMIDYLSSRFAQNPWIMAGDFNLATSSCTINFARKKQTISVQTVQYLRDIDVLLCDAGLQDSWLATRLECGESSDVASDQANMADVFEGEQGATFDPLNNSLAAGLLGNGMNIRPQRYDRILVKASNMFRPQGFNMFGQTPLQTPNGETPSYASDHWGVRCLLIRPPAEDLARPYALPTTVELHPAPHSLDSLEDLKSCLEKKGYFSTAGERALREDALRILERALLDTAQHGTNQDVRTSLALRLVPVGSHGLGVWTGSSDIDCLCIGSISSKTFFALALQRFRKASSQGVSVLRRVRANSGYMLELDVLGIKIDLQYCAATAVAETWPEAMKRPSADPLFSLPM
ncbi:hypothetical protein G7046_g4707 [Stylonectria norvegica]|nr:hypothetical protein G7046_g4707 [Stylonectria norvegica]